jgi:hypothetical protein
MNKFGWGIRIIRGGFGSLTRWCSRPRSPTGVPGKKLVKMLPQWMIDEPGGRLVSVGDRASGPSSPYDNPEGRTRYPHRIQRFKT